MVATRALTRLDIYSYLYGKNLIIAEKRLSTVIRFRFLLAAVFILWSQTNFEMKTNPVTRVFKLEYLSWHLYIPMKHSTQRYTFTIVGVYIIILL